MLQCSHMLNTTTQLSGYTSFTSLLAKTSTLRGSLSHMNNFLVSGSDYCASMTLLPVPWWLQTPTVCPHHFGSRFGLWCIDEAVHRLSLWCYRWQTSAIRKKSVAKWRRCPQVLVHPESPICWHMVCFTAVGSATWRGNYSPLHGSGSSVVSAGQLIMKASSMGYADTTYTMGTSSPSRVHNAWGHAQNATHIPLTSSGKVSFLFVLSISCKYRCPDAILTLFLPFSRHSATGLWLWW